MIGNMTRVKAAAMAKGAQIALVTGVVGSAYLLWAEMPAQPQQAPPPQPPAPKVLPGSNLAKGPVQQPLDPSGVGKRFSAISNAPKAPEPPPDIPGETTTPDEPPKADEPIKYVGPVKIPGGLLAVLSIDGKQRTAGRGKSIGYKVEEASHTAQIVEVGDESITVSEEGKERVIAKAASDGELVSYLGDKPQRNSPNVVSKSGKNAKAAIQTPGGSHSSASLAKQAAANRAQEIMAAKIKTMQDAGEKVPPELLQEMEKQNASAVQEAVRLQKLKNWEKE